MLPRSLIIIGTSAASTHGGRCFDRRGDRARPTGHLDVNFDLMGRSGDPDGRGCVGWRASAGWARRDILLAWTSRLRLATESSNATWISSWPRSSSSTRQLIRRMFDRAQEQRRLFVPEGMRLDHRVPERMDVHIGVVDDVGDADAGENDLEVIARGLTVPRHPAHRGQADRSVSAGPRPPISSSGQTPNVAVCSRARLAPRSFLTRDGSEQATWFALIAVEAIAGQLDDHAQGASVELAARLGWHAAGAPGCLARNRPRQPTPVSRLCASGCATSSGPRSVSAARSVVDAHVEGWVALLRRSTFADLQDAARRRRCLSPAMSGPTMPIGKLECMEAKGNCRMVSSRRGTP